MRLRDRIHAFLNPDARQDELSSLRQQLEGTVTALEQTQLNESRLALQLSAAKEAVSKALLDAASSERRANRAEQDLRNERAFNKARQRDLHNKLRAKR